jgi:hypothetical protein
MGLLGGAKEKGKGRGRGRSGRKCLQNQNRLVTDDGDNHGDDRDAETFQVLWAADPLANHGLGLTHFA